MNKLPSGFLDKIKAAYHKLMNLPDSPSKIAGGVAMGVAMDFLPIPIISIPVSYVVARAVGFKGLAAALTAMMFKVLVPLFYAINIMVGRLILSGRAETAHAVATNFDLTDPHAWLAWLKSLGVPFMVGAGTNAVLAFIVVYFAAKKLFIYRQQKYQQRQTSPKALDKNLKKALNQTINK